MSGVNKPQCEGPLATYTPSLPIFPRFLFHYFRCAETTLHPRGGASVSVLRLMRTG